MDAGPPAADAPPALPLATLVTFPLFHVAGYVMPMYHLRTYPVVLLQSWSVEGPHGQGLDDLPRAASAKEAVAKAIRLAQGLESEA